MTGVFKTAALAVAGLTLAACATESASSPADTVSVESPPLAATVLGEEVRTGDAGEMQKIVLTRLFDRYAEEQGIEVTEAEIDAFVENMQRGMRARGLTAEDELTPEEAAQAEQIRRAMGRSMIRQWKLNRALYCEYGGRIIYQQLGPEPLGAYRRYLEPGSEAEVQAFATPPWKRKPAGPILREARRPAGGHDGNSVVRIAGNPKPTVARSR
jgi:hypothetical protein